MRKNRPSGVPDDFTETKVLDRATYLGVKDSDLTLFHCGCDRPKLWRTPRRWWMRALPLLRLYWCEKCGLRVLRKEIALKRRAYWC